MDKKETYKTHYECLKCGDKLASDTNKKMIHCKCKVIAVDGCEFYVRIIGNEKDWKMVRVKQDKKLK